MPIPAYLYRRGVATDLLLPVRTALQLEAMREAGRVVARALQAVSAAAVPGVRLRELDDIAATCLREAGATPSFLGYTPDWAPTPFNGVTCLSLNEVVVHGRPSSRRLWEGDLLSVDCGAVVDGWNGDSALTVHVGQPNPSDARLRQATEAALAAGIAAARAGVTLFDVGAAVDAVARAAGYVQLPDHGGHGIGRSMHEPPFVPNTPMREALRYRLQPGNTIAIEPMLHTGTSRYRTQSDGWSIATADGKRAAHAEHTIAITDDGPVILTAA